ncbi:MAG: trypsin-like peptidase domain-containing protein, partial [Planctomycetia bacterium]|nr:trypsin-like peptidase domain-containing protein [Planctomycetia bacterium]
SKSVVNLRDTSDTIGTNGTRGTNGTSEKRAHGASPKENLRAESATLAGEKNLREDAIVRAIRRARPAVVNIRGEKVLQAAAYDVSASPESQHVNGMGTGVVIDPRGYIVTNFHVVDGLREIHVATFSGASYIAQVLARDKETDLAIIKITLAPGETLQTICVGSSADLMSGETVIAVGNAFGYEHTVTRGIISALHRSVQVSDVQFYEDLIQTDASINPGNSGGPLLNIYGEMIGINVAVRAGAQGIGFAIPVDRALEIATRMVSTYIATQKWHGIRFMSDSESGFYAERTGAAEVSASGEDSSVVSIGGRGALVESVEKNSPAAAIGLRPGDRILEVNQKKIRNELDFAREILECEPGESVVLKVSRNNRTASARLALGKVSAPAQVSRRGGTIQGAASYVGASVATVSNVRASDRGAEERIWNELGLLMTPIPAVTLTSPAANRYNGGLLVQNVREGSPAHQRGIQRGDILLGIVRWETLSLENVAYILEQPELQNGSEAKFLVARSGKILSGTLVIDKSRTRAR